MGGTTHNRYLPLVAGLCALLVAAALFALTGGDSNSGTASAATGGPEMALNITGGNCDDPVRPTKCMVEGSFTLAVNALSIPNGYILMQTYIDYGTKLTYTQQAIVDEIVWPDLDVQTAVRAQSQAGHINHGGLTGLASPPPSFFTGTLVEIQLSCPNASTSQATIDLMAFDDPVAQTFGSAFFTDSTPIIPKVGSLTINCVAPTPTPTPTPSPPPQMVLNIKGGDCDDAVQPSACHVGAGETFTLSVTALAVPENGYFLMQTYIAYGPGLTYNPQPAALDEIVWPDIDPSFPVRAEVEPDAVTHGGITGWSPPLPASHYTGNLVQAEFTCPSPGVSQHTIELLPLHHPVAQLYGSFFGEAVTFAEIVPAVSGLTVHCDPLPTPTATPTPTSGQAPQMVLNIKGGDCDDAVQPTACYVEIGATFTLSISALSVPDAGYYLMQTYLAYDSGLTYNAQPSPLDEIVWPDVDPGVALRFEPAPDTVYHGGLTALAPPFPTSHYLGNLVQVKFKCPSSGVSQHVIDLLPHGDPVANTNGALFLEAGSEAEIVPEVGSLTVNCSPPPTPTPTMQPGPGDTDGDGCSDEQENGPDEMAGGRRDYMNPHDFYDVAGGGGDLPDGVIDLSNDIFGVIQHYAPAGTEPEYDVNFDRGPTEGPNPWNMTAPDGVIDLSIDILGVIQQYGHACNSP